MMTYETTNELIPSSALAIAINTDNVECITNIIKDALESRDTKTLIVLMQSGLSLYKYLPYSLFASFLHPSNFRAVVYGYLSGSAAP